jgi:hypothetical protein
MKTGTMLLSSCVVLAALILLGSCAPGKYTPKANEELYGTWINKSYGGHYDPLPSRGDPQKEVIDSDGYHVFRFVDDPGQYFVGAETIISKWTDSEGNIWYKTYKGAWSDVNGKTKVPHFLYKLSKSATVRECVYAIRDTYTPSAFPTKIDPKDPSYLLYNRATK